MQSALISLLRILPLRLVYSIMALVIPFYMLLDHKGYLCSYRFYRRRMHYGAIKSFCFVYANEFSLGQTVIDRFALFARKKCEFEFEGHEAFKTLSSSPSGFVQVSAHIGNYELAGFSLRSVSKKIHTLVFPGEKEVVMRNRAEFFSRCNISMVPVSPDMSHIFSLSSALDAGDIVSMPADRSFGSSKTVQCEFMGSPAAFPQGPFKLAASKGVPVLSFFALKESARKYRVIMKEIPSDAAAFADILEDVVRQYPSQWFNFFDFWKS